MNACYGTHVAGLAARMGDEGEIFERRQEFLTDELLSDRDELEAVVWDVLGTDSADKLVSAIVALYTAPPKTINAHAVARKAITDAVAVMVEAAVDERVNAKLRSEGWGV